jgi:hypothetical protein
MIPTEAIDDLLEKGFIPARKQSLLANFDLKA